MLPRRLEPVAEQTTKLEVRPTVHATEHLDVLEGQLERRGLEADVPRRVREHESEVDVDQVPVAVEQDVPVVPVLDLQEVCHERVPRKRPGEVALRADELGGRGIAVCLVRE